MHFTYFYILLHNPWGLHLDIEINTQISPNVYDPK